MRKSGPDTKVQTSSERNNGNGQLRNKKERMEKTRKKNAAKAGVSRRARHTLAQSQQQNQADQLIVRVYERMSVWLCVCASDLRVILKSANNRWGTKRTQYASIQLQFKPAHKRNVLFYSSSSS